MIKRVAQTRKRQSGFTLIELLVVIVILGILSAVVVFAVRGSGDKGHKAAVATDGRIIRTALEVYCAQKGHYPVPKPPEARTATDPTSPMEVLVAEKYLSSPSTYHSLSTDDGLDQGNCPGTPKHYKLDPIETPSSPTTTPPPACPDDGLTWCNETTVPGEAKSINGVSCTDAPNGNSTCVAIGFAKDDQYQSVVYRGTSAGPGSATINWTRANLPPHSAAPYAGTNLFGVDCVDANFCLTVGTTNDGNDTRAVILRTTDGGMSWRRIYLGSPTEYLFGVSCASKVLCVVVGDGTILTSVNSADPVKTDWYPPESVPGPPIFSARFSDLLFDVDCVASSNTTSTLCVAGGVDDSLLRSTDGKNWSADRVPSSDSFTGVSCLTVDSCVADSNQQIYRYASGVWAPVPVYATVTTPVSSDLMSDVSCSALNRCFVVGVKGFAVRSADGGVTWAPQTTPAAKADLSSVSCTPTRCRAVGTVGGKGVIQKIRVPG